jgi:tetratricopeptide (TPR) repeat protein
VLERRRKLKEVGVLLDQVETVEEGSEELFADEEQYIDLAKELEAELAAEEAMVEEATGRGKGEAILEEVFREFQKGVEEQLSEEDADTHFNLGIAYREMGLLPEAIREFQVASRDKDYFVESCSNIGVCYQEQGMWSEAAEWYQKALVAPDISVEARQGLRYDLAAAYQSAGDVDQAAGIFEEIAASDPSYRDVADRLSSLGQQRQAN